MKKISLLLPAFLIIFFAPGFGQQKTLSGYPAADAANQLALEQKFDRALNPADLDIWMKKLTARPHHLGSPYGKENAEYLLGLFRSFGFDAKLERYKVLFPTPVTRLVEMTGPSKFTARLLEPSISEDGTSGQVGEQLPTYNAWSADGDVTGDLVFVNYGVPDDYEQLERMGIDVKGKIVIAKYGGSWRGIKPKVAQEHGAIGCIIYSDPKEDGYFQGDVYPKGPFKNQNGAQRGSVIDMPIYPGDPLTPEIAATDDAKRIAQKDAVVLLKIPVLPIGYSDAQPLLAALTGPVAPEKWRGALPITYHVGPGPAKVHLKLKFDWKLVDCYDVIARMTGAEAPDEWVIRGNHHDAWVNGAGDPVSGLIAELAEAKAIGELVKGGYKPKRTIIYCAWDGEEPGLIGSTEWVEDHAAELREKAVAYINTDGSARGFLGAGGSHTLQPFMGEIARDVIDPQTGVSVFERSKSYAATMAPTSKAKKEILDRKALKINALGSGSDFSGFLQHLGIPTLDMGYGGEDAGGEYHSIYDSYDNYKKFKDAGFKYGVVLAETSGRALLRLADAPVLPFDFTAFETTLDEYVNELTTLLGNMREGTDTENQMIRENRYVQASDMKVKYVAAETKDPVPYLNFSNLQNAVTNLEKSAIAYSERGSLVPSTKEETTHLNRIIYQAEQKLLIAQGLPRRPWYKHSIYAPGFYTGYGVKTLPGIREAIEQRDWKEAQQQIDLAAAAISAYAGEVDAASQIH